MFVKKTLHQNTFLKTIALILGTCFARLVLQPAAPIRTGMRPGRTNPDSDTGISENGDNVSDDDDAKKTHFLLIEKSGFEDRLGGSGFWVRDEYNTEYKYDKNGYRTEKTIYSNGNVYERSEYKYDADGNKTEEQLYKEDGSLNWRYGWEYDKNGNITEMIQYYTSGDIAKRTEYYYDESGNKTGEQFYNEDGSPGTRFTWQYDENGNITEYTGHTENGTRFALLEIQV